MRGAVAMWWSVRETMHDDDDGGHGNEDECKAGGAGTRRKLREGMGVWDGEASK